MGRPNAIGSAWTPRRNPKWPRKRPCQQHCPEDRSRPAFLTLRTGRPENRAACAEASGAPPRAKARAKARATAEATATAGGTCLRQSEARTQLRAASAARPSPQSPSSSTGQQRRTQLRLHHAPRPKETHPPHCPRSPISQVPMHTHMPMPMPMPLATRRGDCRWWW